MSLQAKLRLLCLLAMNVSPPDLEAHWTAPALVSQASSSAAAGAGADPQSWLNHLRDSTVQKRPSTSSTRWMKLGAWTTPEVRAIGGNHAVMDVEYFAFDDLVPFIAGLGAPIAKHGAVGYWHDGPADYLLFPLAETMAAMIVEKLGVLDAGWNGAGSVAPTAEVKADIVTALSALQSAPPEPELEVDDDGSVALLWDEDESSFALTFFGNGRVVGTLSPRPRDFTPEAVDVRDVAALQRLMSIVEARSVVA